MTPANFFPHISASDITWFGGSVGAIDVPFPPWVWIPTFIFLYLVIRLLVLRRPAPRLDGSRQPQATCAAPSGAGTMPA